MSSEDVAMIDDGVRDRFSWAENLVNCRDYVASVRVVYVVEINEVRSQTNRYIDSMHISVD